MKSLEVTSLTVQNTPIRLEVPGRPWVQRILVTAAGNAQFTFHVAGKTRAEIGEKLESHFQCLEAKALAVDLMPNGKPFGLCSQHNLGTMPNGQFGLIPIPLRNRDDWNGLLATDPLAELQSPGELTLQA